MLVGTGTSITLTSPTNVWTNTGGSGHREQNASSVMNIGFTFVFNGSSYTQWSVSTSGTMRLGPSAVGGTWTNSLTGGGAGYPVLAPYWDQGGLSGAYYFNTCGTPRIRYQLVNSAPNRILVVEWKDADLYKQSYWTTWAYGTFQVRLYETTNKIEYYYQKMGTCDVCNYWYGCVNTNGSVGMASSGSDFISVTPNATAATSSTTVANNSVNLNSGNTISNNVMYTFLPPSGSCTIYPPADVTVNSSASQCGENVTFPAPVTSGPCGNVTANPPSGSFFPVGVTTVTFSEPGGQTATMKVTVKDVTNPTITAPPAVTYFVDPNTCARVASHVNLGTPTVADNCSPLSIINDAPPSFPKGVTTVIWTVTDPSGLSSTATQTVTILDNQGPNMVIYMNPNTLWPGDHTMRSVYAFVTINDNCPGSTYQLTSVKSNQADAGLGTDDLPNDIQGTSFGTQDPSFMLRAEQYGFGRYYTINYTAVDADGNPTSGESYVAVPFTKPPPYDPGQGGNNGGWSGGWGGWKDMPGSENGLPTEVFLSQNFPNPFNPTTMIQYSIPEDGFITLKVFDLYGRNVATIVNSNQLSGNYSVVFNASHLPSGTYTYVLEAGGVTTQKTMSLVK